MLDQVPFTLVAAVVAPLATAVVVLWKKNNDLQEKRLNDLKEIQAKTSSTMTDLTNLSQKIYDALPKDKRGQ